MTMNKERLFTELTRKFTEEGIQVARQSDSCLQVLLDGEPVSRIDRFGYSLRSTGDPDSEQANDLYYYAAHVAGVVLEYLSGLEQLSAETVATFYMEKNRVYTSEDGLVVIPAAAV